VGAPFGLGLEPEDKLYFCNSKFSFHPFLKGLIFLLTVGVISMGVSSH
jgi:hypothetical protein